VKLILTQEVPSLGGVGEVIEVKDGYGRNYLIPQGFAIPATRGAEKQVETIRRAREVRTVRDLDQAREIAGQLAGLDVRLVNRAGKGGKLFGSVTPADIVDAVSAAGGPKLDRRRVDAGHPIKTLGRHTVAVRLHPEVVATVNLEVVPA